MLRGRLPVRSPCPDDWEAAQNDSRFLEKLQLIKRPMIKRSMTILPKLTSAALTSWKMLLLLAALVLTSGLTSAQDYEPGSSKRQYRNQAVQSVPYQQLNRQTIDKIQGILEKPSIYRRLPITSINADPDHFRFLVRYPEVIVNIWQLMGVTKMTTERTGPYTVATNDGAGTISELELVYGNENTHIFYGTGTYEGPVIRKKLTGKCVLIFNSKFTTGADGKPVATNQLDVFLKVENTTLGLVAKTIQPIVGATADHNFVESLKFVQRLNDTTEKNGPGVQQMAGRLDIDQDVRKKYESVVDVVFERAFNPEVSRTLYPPANMQSAPASYQPVSSNPSREASDYQRRTPGAVAPASYAPASYSPAQNSSGYQSRQQKKQPRLGLRPHSMSVQQVNYDSQVGSQGAPANSSNSATRIATRPYGYQAPHYSPMTRNFQEPANVQPSNIQPFAGHYMTSGNRTLVPSNRQPIIYQADSSVNSSYDSPYASAPNWRR